MNQDTKKQLLSTLTVSERTRMALFKVVLTECVTQRSIDAANGAHDEGPYLANLANDLISHQLTKNIFSDFTLDRMKKFISSKIRAREIDNMSIDSSGVRLKGFHPLGLIHPEHAPVAVNELALQRSFKAADKLRLTLSNMFAQMNKKVA